jgi:hypothetical protein
MDPEKRCPACSLKSTHFIKNSGMGVAALCYSASATAKLQSATPIDFLEDSGGVTSVGAIPQNPSILSSPNFCNGRDLHLTAGKASVCRARACSVTKRVWAPAFSWRPKWRLDFALSVDEHMSDALAYFNLLLTSVKRSSCPYIRCWKTSRTGCCPLENWS